MYKGIVRQDGKCEFISFYTQSSQKPLVRACKYGRTMVVRLLFDKGVIPEPLAMVEAIRGGYR